MTEPRVAGTPMGTRIVIQKGILATVIGISFETSSITVVAKNSTTLVLKVGGRSCWSGNGCPRVYRSPQMMVYKIIKLVSSAHDVETYQVEPLIEWDVTRK